MNTYPSLIAVALITPAVTPAALHAEAPPPSRHQLNESANRVSSSLNSITKSLMDSRALDVRTQALVKRTARLYIENKDFFDYVEKTAQIKVPAVPDVLTPEESIVYNRTWTSGRSRPSIRYGEVRTGDATSVDYGADSLVRSSIRQKTAVMLREMANALAAAKGDLEPSNEPNPDEDGAPNPNTSDQAGEARRPSAEEPFSEYLGNEYEYRGPAGDVHRVIITGPSQLTLDGSNHIATITSVKGNTVLFVNPDGLKRAYRFFPTYFQEYAPGRSKATLYRLVRKRRVLAAETKLPPAETTASDKDRGAPKAEAENEPTGEPPPPAVQAPFAAIVGNEYKITGGAPYLWKIVSDRQLHETLEGYPSQGRVLERVRSIESVDSDGTIHLTNILGERWSLKIYPQHIVQTTPGGTHVFKLRGQGEAASSPRAASTGSPPEPEGGAIRSQPARPRTAGDPSELFGRRAVGGEQRLDQAGFERAVKSGNARASGRWEARLNAQATLKIATCVSGFRDTGAVATDSRYAAVALSTCTAGGASTGDIIAIVPTASLRAFVDSIRIQGEGYPEISATLAKVQGEPALLMSGVAPEDLVESPSAMLAKQYDEAKGGGRAGNTKRPVR